MKLTKQNIAEMATLLLDGKTSAEVADYFNISVPTVQYHRARLKKNGLKFSRSKKALEEVNVKRRGRKPKSLETLDKNAVSLQAPEKLPKAKAQDLQLKVNGMWVRIDKGAKMVQIHKDHIEISF
jgi:ribosomal protein L10